MRYTALHWIIVAITFLLAPSAHAGGSDSERRLIRIDVDSVSRPVNRYKIVPYKQSARKSVGLAFSGGGSRGLSQIGVIKALEENHIPIDFIVGTSIGSIVGGLYSAGYNAADLEKLSKTLPWSEITSFTGTMPRRDLFLEQKRVRDRASVTLQFDGLKLVIPKSLSTAQPLAKTIDLLILNAPYHAAQDFNSLAIPFCAVASDLITGKRVVLKNQSLSEAMRASATVPFIFSPLKMGSYELVDGGLVSNLPTDVLDEGRFDLKVAVNTMGTLNHSAQELNLPWKAADQVLGILMQEQNKNRLGRATVIITPPIGDHESSDFSGNDSLVAQGYRAGIGIADSLKRLIAVEQKNDIDVRDYAKLLSGGEGLSDSLLGVMQKIAESNAHAKAAMAALLETDYFSDTYAEFDTDNRIITYHIKPLPRFSAVLLSGSRHLPDKKVNQLFAPLFGRNYTNREATAKLEALVKLYREKGYSLVDLTSIRVQHDSLMITTNGDRLSSIEIQRSRKWTRLHVIEREISFDTTHSLKYKQVESSIAQLYNMGIFSRVSVWASYNPDSTGAVSPSMIIKIDERLTEVLRFGFRVDDVYSSQFLLDFRNENFLGLATELGGWTTIGTRNFSAQIEFRAHRLWSTYLTFFTRLFYEQRNIYRTDITFAGRGGSPNRDRLGEYGQQFYGASAAIGGQLYRDGQATIELLKQNAQVYPASFYVPRAILDLKTLRFRFALDTRNDPVDANSGTFMDIYYDINPRFLGNDVIFSKIIFNYEDNFPIVNTLSWRLKLNMGIADNRTPFCQQFSLGGVSSAYSTTFYGLRLDDYRGRQLFAVGLGLKFDLPVQIVFPTSFAIHYNTGNVWPESSTLLFRNFIHGVGATLSLRTPIGPAQLSISQAFMFSKTEESTLIQTAPPVYYFVLGYEF